MIPAVAQYVELYLAHRDLIDRNSCEVMNRLRSDACRVLEEKPIPERGAEDYEHTDLPALLAPDYGINLSRVNIDVNPADTFHCDVPNLSTSLFLMINDRWSRTETSYTGLPEGVEICNFADFSQRHPDLAEKYYGKIADINNPVVALNTMLVQDGFVLYVRKGVKVEKPIQLVNILQNGMPLMALRRLLVILEEDSEARLLVCDHTQNPDTDFLTVQTIEIFAARNSVFDYYDLEDSTERTNRLSSLYLRQEEGSNVLIDGITLFNGKTRNEYRTFFTGSHSSLRLLGMGIIDKKRQLENYTRVAHDVAQCNTDELFKYVVDEEASGSFTGRIYVAEGACKTEAYQSNRNLLGSDTARMFSKPQLEIYNDDVKCSHGTAIGRLDAMQMFYMRTRGLSEEEATLLLKQAFMADVIDGVRLPILRDRLRHLVECRFAGENSACNACKSHPSSPFK